MSHHPLPGADVIAWLRSEAGEQWSRIAHAGGAVDVTAQPPTFWTPGGLLHPASDPCGAGPLKDMGRQR
jgi:hypothetical protein